MSAVVDAARACVGTSFRPQGRLPGVGLDCAGVALIAARAAGAEVLDRRDYRLRDACPDALAAALDRAGRRRGAGERGRAGDLLLLLVAPGRGHLAVATDRGAVHAHAGLSRVVERPLDPDWELLGAWMVEG